MRRERLGHHETVYSAGDVSVKGTGGGCGEALSRLYLRTTGESRGSIWRSLLFAMSVITAEAIYLRSGHAMRRTVRDRLRLSTLRPFDAHPEVAPLPGIGKSLTLRAAMLA